MLSKDGKLSQFTPDTSWMSSAHNQPSHLDQNGRSFNSLVSLCDWVLLKYTHTLSLTFSLIPFICRLFFSHKHSFSSLPSHFSHPCCLPRLHIKADDWFLTVQQAVFYPALCEETKIISMNMEKLLLW